MSAKRDFTVYTAYILSHLRFQSGPLVSLLLIITAVQTSQELCELFVHGGLAMERAVDPAVMNKSLFQAL